jgi:hypothetical protein
MGIFSTIAILISIYVVLVFYIGMWAHKGLIVDKNFDGFLFMGSIPHHLHVDFKKSFPFTFVHLVAMKLILL